MKPCTKCSEIKSESDFYKDDSKKDGLSCWCKDCQRKRSRKRYHEKTEDCKFQNKEWNIRNRNLVLDKLGNKCVCCGEATREFLAVDHIFNDGAVHRKQIGGYSKSICKWLVKNNFKHIHRFQILCHNCNVAKEMYGICPHQGVPSGNRTKMVEHYDYTDLGI